MTTITVKNSRTAAVPDFSNAATRETIVEDATRAVRSDELTLVRRLMRQRGRAAGRGVAR